MTKLVRTALNQRQREVLWTRQNGCCPICRDPLTPGGFEDDHILALIDGGTNALENRRLICTAHHRLKSALEHKANSKAKRLKFGRTKSGKTFAKRADPWGNSPRRKRCADCGMNWVCPPQTICDGCEAHREHTGHF